MEKKEKVSVIIPVYNTGKYLMQCVDSVVKQTYKNLQIILVDDGSTDDSGNMCDKIAQKDNRIQVIHKQNEGLGLTRNKGLEYVEGRYVTFLDSDDWFLQDHIEMLMQSALNSNADLVIGSRTKFFSDKKETFKQLDLSLYGEFSGEDIKTKVLPEIISASPNSNNDLGIPMSVCFNLYSSDIITKNKILFPSERYCVSEDFFFNYKYIRNCQKVVIIKEYGYIYRNTPMSISHSFNEEQISRVFNFYTEAKKLVFEDEISNDTKLRVYRCTLSKIRSLLIRLVTSSVTYNNKIKIIKKIVSNQQTKEILSKFDYRIYPLKLRFFTICLKYERTRMIYFLLTIRKK